MKKIILTFLSLLIVNNILATVKVQAYVDNNSPAVGEGINLTIEISGEKPSEYNVETFKIADCDVQSAGVATRSQSTYTNAGFETQVTKSYNFTIFALKKKNFVIPQILVTNGKKKIYTKPIKISVGAVKKRNNNSNSNRYRQSNSSAYSQNISDNIFIKAEFDKNQVFFVNKQFEVSYYFYTAYQNTEIGWRNEPVFNDFVSKNTFKANSYDFSLAVINGKRYKKMKLTSYDLIPSKEGKAIIPKLEILTEVSVNPSSFFNMGPKKKYSIVSKPVSINVINVPAKNRPANYTGAIGNFSINASCSETKLKAGDSFTYTVAISGKGNIGQIDNPKLDDNPHFRFTEPEVSSKNNTKTFKYMVIALDEGNFSLNPVKFSYYNPKAKKYVSKQTKAFDFSVSASEQTYAITSQGAVVLKNSDIAFDKTSTKPQKPFYLVNNIGYWLLLILGFVASIVFVIVYSLKVKQNSNLDYARQKNAHKIIKKYLSIADDFAQKAKPEFYSAAQNGLISYVCDLFILDKAMQSSEIIESIKAINEDIAIKLKQFMQKCDEARFMPGGLSPESISNDFEELKNLISNIAKSRKK